jgi:hypothetical protein
MGTRIARKAGMYTLGVSGVEANIACAGLPEVGMAGQSNQ